MRTAVKTAARGPLAALFFLLAAAALCAQDKVGSVTYLEGEVSVVRNGDPLDGVAIGVDVQNFDVVKTGADGMAELDISSAQIPRMTVKISPDTQFSLELAALGGKQQTTIGIVGGSLSLKVARLASSQDLQVKTDFAAMGVRGTDFTVTTPPTGDVLVTCDEGDVVCTDEQGKELHAIPGTVVEKRPGELFRNVPVALGGAAAYRTQWGTERLRVMESNALKLIQANALLYERHTRELNATYVELMKSQAVIGKWTTEDRAGRIGLRNELSRERLAVGAQLARLRRTVFQLERVTFRLARLSALHDRGFGQGTLASGITTAQFFARLESERVEVARKLAFTRYVAKMYAKRNQGALP
jgi:hypothetical protein